MRQSNLIAPIATAFAAAAILFSVIAGPALAESSASAGAAQAPAPALEAPPRTPTFTELAATLTRDDQLAVLEAIHVGLSELGDGATYIWHRRTGRLGGTVKPTQSFRDREGRVCRHLVFTLSLAEHTRSIEGMACRQADRSWVLG